MVKTEADKKISVLIIEDNEDYLYFLRKALPESRFSLTEIQSGREGLKYLLNPKKHMDVVLLDNYLPEMSGLEILEIVKEEKLNYGFIFLTVDNTVETVVKAMNLGALDFVVKSQNLQNELPEKIEKIYKIRRNVVENEIMEKEAEMAKRTAEYTQRFIAQLSHELRTPITGVLGMSEIMSKTDLDDEQRDYLNTIIQSGENLRETINLTLDYLKIEAGQAVLNEQDFVLKELVDSAKDIFSALCYNKEISFETEIDKQLPKFIKSDKYRVNHVINNLISNAIKYTKSGRISLFIRKENEVIDEDETKQIIIKIEVKDTGAGISPENQKMLFKPFFQVSSKVIGNYDSSGIGLSICHEFTHLLGGEIGVESEKGKGSTFWFNFKAKPVSKIMKQEKELTSVKSGGKTLNILLVEDQIMNQKVISLILGSLGHNITTANNGEIALELFSPGKFDLILMDIQMPVMDGIKATQTLKERYDVLPPIVGLSAHALEGDREKFMQLGMDEYLVKPLKDSDFDSILIKLGKYF